MERGPGISEGEARKRLHAFVHDTDHAELSSEECDKVIAIAFNDAQDLNWESALDVMSDDEAKESGTSPAREDARQQRGRAIEEARQFLDAMGYKRKT